MITPADLRSTFLFESLNDEQVAALIEQVSRTDPETVARVRAAMENK